MEDAFFLAYGGLRWSVQEVLDLPTEKRRWFVKRLEMQKEAELAELKKQK